MDNISSNCILKFATAFSVSHGWPPLLSSASSNTFYIFLSVFLAGTVGRTPFLAGAVGPTPFLSRGGAGFLGVTVFLLGVSITFLMAEGGVGVTTFLAGDVFLAAAGAMGGVAILVARIGWNPLVVTA
jgi:hypothetical protein